MTVGVTHTGDFSQGDVGDTYTITVTNSVAGPTVGTVSLVDTLPTGLTATAMSGTGWTVDLSTLTATRSDVLAAGRSYPLLTLTVNVADDAPVSVVNTATVSGGGESNTSNDTATDSTTITPPSTLIAGALTPPQATAGVAFTNVVLFQFSDSSSTPNLGSYRATITWGDGTTSIVTQRSQPRRPDRGRRRRVRRPRVLYLCKRDRRLGFRRSSHPRFGHGRGRRHPKRL